MAQVLNSVLGIFVNPKKVIAIDESKLENLDGKTAHILFAVGEAVLGENFLAKAPNFITVIDDYLTFQRRSQREALSQA
ncbi:MAG: hypothetical protein M3430_10450, partial [Acidobacteriota bacterium]|nr:hypothetical protein [Acidobacteriota bacterium]